MLVASELAQSAFEQFDSSLRIATLSPEFAVKDAVRVPCSVPQTWFYVEASQRYMISFHRESIPGTDYYDLQSPYPYGGPISNSTDSAFLERANRAFSDWCRENAIVVEFVRLHPMLENWRFFDGRVFDDRLTVWIDLTTDDLFSTYETRVRTAIRKAKKNGLEVVWVPGSAGAQQFYEIYTEAMMAIQADPFYLFPKTYFEALLDWHKAELAICKVGDQVLGGAIFLHEGNLMEYHLSATNLQGKHLGANNLLLHSAAEWGQSAGLAKLYLGGGTNAHQENPLFFFKAGFSSQRAIFKFGGHIHDTEAYEVLKQKFATEYEANPRRVLFYR